MPKPMMGIGTSAIIELSCHSLPEQCETVVALGGVGRARSSTRTSLVRAVQPLRRSAVAAASCAPLPIWFTFMGYLLSLRAQREPLGGWGTIRRSASADGVTSQPAIASRANSSPSHGNDASITRKSPSAAISVPENARREALSAGTCSTVRRREKGHVRPSKLAWKAIQRLARERGVALDDTAA